MFVLRAFGVWLLILVLAIANGGLREWLLLPHLGTPLALWISGVLLCLGIVALTYAFLPRLHVRTRRGLWQLGLLWLLLTLAFEFGFGRLVQGHSWPELLAAYTFEDGNLWPLVLLVTLVAPRLVARMRRPPEGAAGSGPTSGPT